MNHSRGWHVHFSIHSPWYSELWKRIRIYPRNFFLLWKNYYSTIFCDLIGAIPQIRQYCRDIWDLWVLGFSDWIGAYDLSPTPDLRWWVLGLALSAIRTYFDHPLGTRPRKSKRLNKKENLAPLWMKTPEIEGKYLVRKLDRHFHSKKWGSHFI